jgi:hypothetical protein
MYCSPEPVRPDIVARNLRARLAAIAFAILVFSLVIPSFSMAAPQFDSDRAVSKAQRFLAPRERGEEILEYVHLGADYTRHELVRYVPYESGGFALIYRFVWKTTDLGYTFIAFNFDSQGNFSSLKVGETDATFNLPFLFADLSIKVVGNMFIQAHKNDMKREDLDALQKLIDNADAKSLLEWSLRLDQLFGS